jgi:hypothetical protein
MNILTGHACSTNGYYKTNKQQQQVIIQIYQNKYNSMHDDQVLQKKTIEQYVAVFILIFIRYFK